MTRRRAPTLRGPVAVAAQVRRLDLENGLRVVLCPRPHLAQTHVTMFFAAGSRFEDARNNGLTHVLEHMVFRGTRRFPDATALNAAAEELGGYLDGATFRDHVLFGTACHPSRLERALEILSELIMRPRYDSIEVERSILREELLETLDRRGRMIDLDNIAHRTMFGSHGLGLPIEGTLENLASFSRADIDRFRRRILVGANAVLAIAGPFDANAIAKRAARIFGALPAGQRVPLTPPPEVTKEPVLRYVRDRSSQVDIRLSFRAVPIGHPSYAALVMLARLLADGLSSRMHAELVDRRGLAYALHAGLTTYDDCGLFEFDVTVAPNRAAAVIRAILEFAKSSIRFRFTAAERTRSLRRYRYAMEFMEDDPADLVGWHGRAALFGIEHAMRDLEGQLGRATDAEIRAAARETFDPTRLTLVAVGELARGEWARVRAEVRRWARNRSRARS